MKRDLSPHLPNVVEFRSPLMPGVKIGDDERLVFEVAELHATLVVAGAPRPVFVALHEKTRAGSMLTMFVCFGPQTPWRLPP